MATKSSLGSLASTSQLKQPKRQVSKLANGEGKRISNTLLAAFVKEDASKKFVEHLWCESCRRLEDKIRRRKNFSVAWISGLTSQKLSNVVDHAHSDQHQLSMTLMSTVRANAMNRHIIAYSPIAKSLLIMDDSQQQKMSKG